MTKRLFGHFSLSALPLLLILAAPPCQPTESDIDQVFSAPTPIWRIPERLIPTPQGASTELIKFLESIQAPKRFWLHETSPTTKEEWIQLIDVLESAKPFFDLRQFEENFNVRVTELRISGVLIHEVSPKRPSQYGQKAGLLHFHGGAHVFDGGIYGVYEALLISSYTGLVVWSVDYSMPPEYPYPAGFNDALAVYTELTALDPKIKVALGGTSAGGGLAIALTQEIIRRGLDLPWAIYAGSPWVDLSKTGDTLYTLEGIDHVLVTYDGLLAAAARLYAGNLPLKSPLVSPIYGEFERFPPTYMVTGTRDLYLSDTIRLHRKLKTAGSDTELNVYEGLSHAEYLRNPSSIESQQVYLELSEFLRSTFESKNVRSK